MILPNNNFSSEWVDFKDMPSNWFPIVFDELDRCTHAPGWNPKLKRLSGDTYMIDVCSFRGPIGHYRKTMISLPHSVHVVEYVDHPFLSELPENAPRVVKAIYRKDVRLKHLRATELWPVMRDLEEAERAWRKYLGAAK